MLDYFYKVTNFYNHKYWLKLTDKVYVTYLDLADEHELWFQQAGDHRTGILSNAHCAQEFGLELWKVAIEKLEELAGYERSLPLYREVLDAWEPDTEADWESYLTVGAAMEECKYKVGIEGKSIRKLARLVGTIPVPPRNPDFDAAVDDARRVGVEELFDGNLRRSGSMLVGRCQLHGEKTASFALYGDGHFHCYGCGAHGSDGIGYLMLRDGIGFSEAVTRLAGGSR